MIPNDAKNNFQEIITHEMFEMSRALDGIWSATTSKMIAKGLGTSSPHMQVLATDAVNSLKARSQFILGQLLRCLTAYRVPLTPEVIAEAKGILKQTIETQSQTIQSHLFSKPVFHGQNMAAARQQIQAQYAQEGPRLITRLSTELTLAAAASTSQNAAQSSSSTLNFNGPVGLVQSGNGNQATVNQHIDTGVKNEIIAALQALTEELDKPENASVGSLTELRELVIETKTEAEKTESNSLKLGSGLRTIAETTKFIGSLGPAYQIIKPLLSYFGIHVP